MHKTLCHPRRVPAWHRLVAGLALLALPLASVGGEVFSTPPAQPDPAGRYLFYLHGAALELGGRQADKYDYRGILDALAQRGFIVIGEVRGMTDNDDYADKIATQVRTLLTAGVPASHITVAGHSKGGDITLRIMARLANPDLAFANLAGCGISPRQQRQLARFAEKLAATPSGHLLSIYDRRDAIAGSCEILHKELPEATRRELPLDTGGGHELFYRPDPVWLDPLQAWAEMRAL